ncbi:peptidase, M48 family protein [Mycobacteroides abscessus subsp. abscessus]|nr:peptidase, M48 family protein [Mycobacteroides abscessus subsp. abscessus]
MSDLPNRTYSEFPGISTRAWEHPADRAALQTLRSLKGFDSILKALAALLRGTPAPADVSGDRDPGRRPSVQHVEQHPPRLCPHSGRSGDP